jgi:ribosomal protein L37AE/L43A
MKKLKIYNMEKEEDYCDICESEATHKCRTCGMDLCEKHANKIWICDTEGGDWKFYYCDKHAKKMRKFEEDLRQFTEEMFEAETNIDATVEAFFVADKKAKEKILK